MNIRFISSLTSDDEDRIAPALLAALTSMLDQTAITYALRIETSGHQVYQHDHPVTATDAPGGGLQRSAWAAHQA